MIVFHSLGKSQGTFDGSCNDPCASFQIHRVDCIPRHVNSRNSDLFRRYPPFQETGLPRGADPDAGTRDVFAFHHKLANQAAAAAFGDAPPQPEFPRCPAKVWSRRRNRIFAILSRGWPGCATTRAEPARPSAATAACKDAGQRSLVCRAHRKRRACVPRHASWRSMISPQAPSSAHQMLGPCRASTPEW